MNEILSGTSPTPNADYKSHLMLIDGSAFVFRAYHALPPLTRNSDGLPLGAVSGFCNMLWKIIYAQLSGAASDHVTHLAVIFDPSAPTFRSEIYPQYKANRDETPQELIPQLALVRKAVEAFGVAGVECDGFEADDVIATYCRIASEQKMRVTILSGDKDLMQLITPQIEMLDTMKERRFDIDAVHDKFGVGPEKVVEVQALAGDSIDNVPGVPGIGLKTAAQLINEYGDLENLLAKAGEIKQKKRRENLLLHAQDARLSRRLVELRCDVPVTMPLEKLAVAPFEGSGAVGFLRGMEINSLTRRIGDYCEIDVGQIAPAKFEIPGWDIADRAGRLIRHLGDGGAAGAPKQSEANEASDEAGASDANPLTVPSPADLARSRRESGDKIPFSGYEKISDPAQLTAWVEQIYAQGHVAFDTETTSLDAMQADIVGISLAITPGKACYIPITHRDGPADLLNQASRCEGQIELSQVLAILAPMLADPSILKIAQNAKYDALILRNHGVEVTPIDDTMLISYVLDSGSGGHGMDALSVRWLDHQPITFQQVAGSGKAMLRFDEVPIDKALDYAAEDADVTLRLWHILKPQLTEKRLHNVYETLERPLVKTLTDMEARGIKIDTALLSKLSNEFACATDQLAEEIYRQAGSRFNIASTKQLTQILFEQMGFESGKKTAKGAYSTSAQVLEDLAAKGHEFPKLIIDWRQLAKLKSTYSDALPHFVNPKTGRVHTSYAMASTSTGRLSSSDPNLQNIPIRTAEGRKIREAFIAEEGNRLLSADYSQIELRVLAHIADIASLKQAFLDGLDIHAMTASEMFNIPIKNMDAATRRRAKAINFGIIYGISAFGLANQLGISRSEASEYMTTYFSRFPGIRDYMEETKAFVRQHHYVETLFGRRAHYPQIAIKDAAKRGFWERAAINAPIQGSAADIIRRAMIRMDDALQRAKLSAKMLLQVHDELVFEVPESELEETAKLVCAVMRGASEPAVTMAVPLEVDANYGRSWDDAH